MKMSGYWSAAAPIMRLKQDYRYHFVLKSPSREKLNTTLRAMLEPMPGRKSAHAGDCRYGCPLADVIRESYFQAMSNGETVNVSASIIAASTAIGQRLAGTSG